MTIFRIIRFGTSPTITGTITGTNNRSVTKTTKITSIGTSITATITARIINQITGNLISKTAGPRITARTRIISATIPRTGIMTAIAEATGAFLKEPATK